MDPTNLPDLKTVQDALFTSRLINAISACAATASAFVAIWVGIRRKPPLDRELAQLRTRADCVAIHSKEKDDHRKDHDAIEARSVREHNELNDRLLEGAKQFQAIERTLGRIEQGMSDLREDLGNIRSDINKGARR